MDIAVESSFVARRTYLAARRGAWVIPKYVFGRPLDTLPTSARVPYAVRRRVQARRCKLMVGDMERYGLPRPDHPFGAAHPTVSDDILSRIAHGEITPKPNIAELTERTVRFADGTEVDADVVVYCTGYKVTFPFLDPALIAAPDNDLPLFRRVFHPDVPGIYFVGLLQPLGAIMPLAELQSQWICDHLAGRYALPPRARAARRHRGRARGDVQALRRAPSATRCRSTSRTTCSACGASAGAARAARRRPRERRAARERTKAANRAALRRRRPRRVRRAGYEAAGVRDIVRRTGPGVGHVLQLLPRQGGDLPRGRRGDGRRGAAPRPRRAHGRRRARRVRRGRLPRVLRVHRRGPGDVRVPAPQRCTCWAWARDELPLGARGAGRGPGRWSRAAR